MKVVRVARVVLVLLCVVQSAAAQEGVRLVMRAESLAAVGDMPGAHAAAVEATNRDPANARAWLARGLAAAAQRPFPIGRFGIVPREYNDWQREAVEAVTRATQLEPDSARYWVELGVVQALSNEDAPRNAALTALRRGRDLAVERQNGLLASRAHQAIGWWYWRRFERAVIELPASPETHNELRAATPGDSAQRDTLENFLEWGHGWQGDYLDATEHFHRAVFADSSNSRARLDVLRALVTFERWAALEEVALQQVRDIGWDGWSWLALGLARHRRGDPAAAAVAYDSAMTRLTDVEREYFLDLTRVLPPGAADPYQGRRDALRADAERFYWLHSDPLWLQTGNGRQLEFLSRITFAELRWSAADLGVRGLETDPGRAYVRYGPPNRIAGADTNRLGVAHFTWHYPGGLALRFVSQPFLGAVQLDPESAAKLREHAGVVPVSWPRAADDGFVVRDVAIQSAVFLPRRGTDPVDSLSLVVLARSARRGSGELGVFLADVHGRSERIPASVSPFVSADDSVWSAFEATAPGVSSYVRFERRDTAQASAVRAVAELAPLPEVPPYVSDLLVARCLISSSRPARWFDAVVALGASESCPSDRLLIMWEEGNADAGVGGGSARITLRAGVEDDLEALLRLATDPRAAGMEVRALGSSERSVRLDALSQRGNREINLTLPLSAALGRATLRYVELSFTAVKRSNFQVTLTRTFPDGRVVTRERRIPWWS